MKKTVLKTTIAVAMAMLVTGCGGGGSDEPISNISGNSSSGKDTMAIAKTISPKGFIVLWDKKSSGYSEIIYTDDLNKKRGKAYLMSANFKGFHKMVCKEVYSTTDGAGYSCKADNVTYSHRIYLESGVEYKWLVNYSDGLNFKKGKVEAITTYDGSELNVKNIKN